MTDRTSKTVSTVSEDTLAEAIVCCDSWEPEARLIGNVRAVALGDLLRELRGRRREFSDETPAKPVAWRYVIDSGYEPHARYGYSDHPVSDGTPLYERQSSPLKTTSPQPSAFDQATPYQPSRDLGIREGKTTAPQCIWRTGCKSPDLCQRNQMCIPGGEHLGEGKP